MLAMDALLLWQMGGRQGEVFLRRKKLTYNVGMDKVGVVVGNRTGGGPRGEGQK